MNKNVGKVFEKIFEKNWLSSFPNTFIYRLHDLTTGYKITSQNPCDFIAFNSGCLWLLEVKSHNGASIPFDAIPQYERLLKYKDMNSVIPLIIIWFKDKDTVWAIPIKEAEKMVLNGEKSIGIRMLNKLDDSNKNLMYNIIEIPSVKKRVFLDSDYSCLLNLKEDE